MLSLKRAAMGIDRRCGNTHAAILAAKATGAVLIRATAEDAKDTIRSHPDVNVASLWDLMAGRVNGAVIVDPEVIQAFAAELYPEAGDGFNALINWRPTWRERLQVLFGWTPSFTVRQPTANVIEATGPGVTTIGLVPPRWLQREAPPMTSCGR